MLKFFLNSKHIQTIWGTLWRQTPDVERVRHQILTPDRDFLHADVVGEGNEHVRNDVGVIIWHGLTGSSSSHYVLGLQNELIERNILSVAVNHRGCSGEPNWLARSYHAGDFQDIGYAVNWAMTQYPGRRWVVCGFSLGGSMLINWLNRERAMVPAAVCGAVGVSVPFDLTMSSQFVDKGLSKFYRNRLLNDLKMSVIQKLVRLRRLAPEECRKILELGNIMKHRDFRSFDGGVVAPLHGFESCEHYYESSSVRSQLAKVDTPLMLIHSRDDPLIPEEAIPGVSELNPNTTLMCTPIGGHVGFLRFDDGLKYWLEELIAAKVEQFLGKNCCNA